LRAVERARSDIESGRLWKARDRLTGALRHDPADQEVLELLVEVSTAMGDLPAAGLYSMLTAGDVAPEAEAAVRERYRGAYQVLRALPVRPPLERYPERARNRLATLIRVARDEGHSWEPKIAKIEGRDFDQPLGLRGFLGTVLLLAFTVGIWLLGWAFLVTRVL
jgi:hypothetical protein